jgi:acetyltransferase-like isoleucine patch superfamily enzyme
MKSCDFEIKEGKEVPYGDQVKSFKQTFKNGGNSRGVSSFRYAWIRIRNYFIFLLAYIAPSNRIRVGLNRWKGVNIADGAYVGMFVFFDNAYPDYIYIEEDASINAGSMLITHFNPKEIYKKVLQARVDPIVIKKGAIVAVRSIIMPGVVVGVNSIVSAMSVVYENVEEKTLVRGNPAKKIGKIKL